LILNPRNRTRYIKAYWPKQWAKLILVTVKKLWEKYKEEVVILTFTITPFSYGASLGSSELLELDEFDCIALSLYAVAWLASKDKYENYNSQELYDPGKARALA
jgi:hypothetical protein